MLTAFDKADTPDRQAHVIQALKVISHKTGLYGMLGGQSVDVENDGKPMSREMIDYIYENKNGSRWRVLHCVFVLRCRYLAPALHRSQKK